MRKAKNTNDPIDIVLPWVDGTDPVWAAEKARFRQQVFPDEKANSAIRYQDWENLQYWFRAVEKFLPWVHRIFFITCGHLPAFLDTSNPKLRIVRHEEYMPQEYLPTFQVNPLELNLHRIDELSENFIYFNDDMFPIRPIPEAYYFRGNQVCDEGVEGHITPVDIGDISHMARYVQANNMLVINCHFKKREVQKAHFFQWFSPAYGKLLMRNLSLHYWYDFAGFHDPHMPNAFHKSTLAKIWEQEGDVLDETSRHRFRTYSDVSQYLIRYWQLCEGDFHPRRERGKNFFVTEENCAEIAAGITAQKWPLICLNENCTGDVFVRVKKEINAALARLLPEKSSFER